MSLFIEYLLVAIFLASVGALFYYLILHHYQDLERRTIEGLAGYAQQVYDYFDRLFIRKTLSQCYMLIIFSTGSFGFLGFASGLYLGLMPAIWLMAVFTLIGFRLPGFVLKKIFEARVKKFDVQLVDALTMMSSAIKSGLSFMQTIQVIEQEMPNPCSQEFGMVLKENRVGVNMNDALLNMANRVPSADLFMIINSVVTLSQQGGDLSEAFETIAATIRERQRIHEKIRTLAQAGLTQATILSALPFVMMGVLNIVQPTYVSLLIGTPLGWFFVGLIFVFILAGILWMRKILTIEI
jgi:tight adherence protein B